MAGDEELRGGVEMFCQLQYYELLITQVASFITRQMRSLV